MRTQLRNQLHALVQQPIVIVSVQTRLETLITTLDQEIATVEQEIVQTLQQDDAWAAAAARLQTIKGLGTLRIAWAVATKDQEFDPAYGRRLRQEVARA